MEVDASEFTDSAINCFVCFASLLHRLWIHLQPGPDLGDARPLG